jgi:hypothetical protein
MNARQSPSPDDPAGNFSPAAGIPSGGRWFMPINFKTPLCLGGLILTGKKSSVQGFIISFFVILSKGNSDRERNPSVMEGGCKPGCGLFLSASNPEYVPSRRLNGCPASAFPFDDMALLC